MTIKTDMLRYFVAVAEVGNLSKAAKKLQRSPAAISMMLKQFEEELGSPLFETDRKSHLTALGEFTLAEAKRELVHFENSVSAILKFAESGEGQVRVAAMPAAVANLLPKVIGQMHEENPNILVNVEDITNAAILAKLQSKGADIGIVNNLSVTGSAHLKSAHLMSDRLGVLCARDSALGRKEKLYWSDLATAPMVHHKLCDVIDEPPLEKRWRRRGSEWPALFRFSLLCVVVSTPRRCRSWAVYRLLLISCSVYPTVTLIGGTYIWFGTWILTSVRRRCGFTKL